MSSSWLSSLESAQETVSRRRHPPGRGRSTTSTPLCDGLNLPFPRLWSHVPRSKLQSLSSRSLYEHIADWLFFKAAYLAESDPRWSSVELFDRLKSALLSHSDVETLEASLFDILGPAHHSLIPHLLGHRDTPPTTTDPRAQGSNAATSQLGSAPDGYTDLPEPPRPTTVSNFLDPSRSRPVYPNVYRSAAAGGNLLSEYGSAYSLPVGSVFSEQKTYDECTVPATKTGSFPSLSANIQIADMDGLCQMTFRGYEALNQMQSLVYPIAYKTNENMLICAPTGAGKTDAAILTMLGTVRQYVNPNPLQNHSTTTFTVDKSQFKIVYVAPMKALAAEVAAKLSRRLSWLGIQVRELTGDMQLSKAEIIQTQIIVTTPEKWDVVTRKSVGDTELVLKVRLLIIDEVHMLHDERGAVLESLVARTQRQVESTQSLIRIVGLSATLPNFMDVADFLKVNKQVGMFFFDSSFRPVPLEQHFIGVKGKSRTKQFQDNLDNVTYEKAMDVLNIGPDHQVMVFVHSRKDTLKSAKSLLEKAAEHGEDEFFDATSLSTYQRALREINQSKSKDIRQLIQRRLGLHHAGMPRSDRNLIERLFSEGVIKILFCTATLAWGVNLPASAVIIKGTQVYSAQVGKHVDLSILDVVQIFGRAGRPQFQSSGIGYILTSHDKMKHYISTVTQQLPIESSFSKTLRDNLNAEIALGTVTSVAEGVQWLGYSYLFVRMQKNPTAYGIEFDEIGNDPQLHQRRLSLIVEAATSLQFSQMITFNRDTQELKPRDIGRIASQFYVTYKSVVVFNKHMHAHATEADVFKLLSLSEEFEQIRSRDSEDELLTQLVDTVTACQIEGGVGSPQAKTNILLQAHISRARLEDFTLVSDMAYVAQNSARLCRALFMIALNRRWGQQCVVLLSLCKAIEKQYWPFQHPLCQFQLPNPTLERLEADPSRGSIDALLELSPDEIGSLVKSPSIGRTISNVLPFFPRVSVQCDIVPLNRDVLRVSLSVKSCFRWSEKHHGFSEPFWIWIENSDTSEIYHHECLIIKKQASQEAHTFEFTVPAPDPVPSQLYVRVVSDHWLGSESVLVMPFQHLVRPDTQNVYTELLDLQPLPVSALDNPILEDVYSKSFAYFNPMQTQLFHTLYHSRVNVFLGSPTGSGKTVAAELAMWHAFRDRPGCKVVYIAPMKALVRERMEDWERRLATPLGLKMVELTGDHTPEASTISNADIIVATPEKWDGITRSWRTRSYVRAVGLVILDEIHLLGCSRGPVLEIIVSRMNYIASTQQRSVRILGMSTACANVLDLASWLGVSSGLFNFRHSIRPVPLETYIEGFPDQRGFSTLMQSMNRPTFLAIKAHSPNKPVLVFVSSRRQTRLTAGDLMNYCGLEDNPRRFLNMTEDELAACQSCMSDDDLKTCLAFGIGIHHAGMSKNNRRLVEELFVNGKIQILIATSTLAWGVNLPAFLVIVKGTQFFDAKVQNYRDMDLTDVLQMIGRAGRPQFDNSGVALVLTQESRKSFYKHFLHHGFPVESSLHHGLTDHIGAEIATGALKSRQDCLDYLTCTFLFRRLHSNPSFYGLMYSDDDEGDDDFQQRANLYLNQLVATSLSDLSAAGCIDQSDGFRKLASTTLGRIMSEYYLSSRSVSTIASRSRLTPEPSFADVLAWLSLASEYDDLPVRHNEDLINKELAQSLPFNIDALGRTHSFGDPHVKVFLLLQAHLLGLELPGSDYVSDLHSVLDQSVRITQAMIEVVAEGGNVTATKLAILLLQSLNSVAWPSGVADIASLPIQPRRHRRDGSGINSSAAVIPSDSPVEDIVPNQQSVLSGHPWRGVVVSALLEPGRSRSLLKVTMTRKPTTDPSCPSTFSKPQLEKQVGRFFLLLSSCQGSLLGLKRVSLGAVGDDEIKSVDEGPKPLVFPTITTELRMLDHVSQFKVTLMDETDFAQSWDLRCC